MRKRMVVAVLAVLALIALLLTASSVVASPPRQGPDVEGEVPDVEGEVISAAVVGSGINYQGRLTDSGGNPLTATYDMVFQLWDSESMTTQVGGDISVAGVTVTDGLFNVKIPVTQSWFNGQALWLRVKVGADDWMTPLQEIVPVPYALSLRPGAIISDTTSYVRLNRSLFSISPPASYKYGVYAKAEGATYNYGVYGSGSTAAIYGSGDVKQNLAGNGLVKAAVYVNCNNDLLLGNIRGFNNVTSNAIFPSPGPYNGRCTLDFGFDISDRFWVATAVGVGGTDAGVNCWLGTNTRLDCFRYDASSGTGVDGNIMVLVY